MGRGTWRNSELVAFGPGGEGSGLQFPGLGVSQGKDMKHVKMVQETCKTHLHGSGRFKSNQNPEIRVGTTSGRVWKKTRSL